MEPIGRGGPFRLPEATLILTWLGALSGCGSGVDATSSTDGSADVASNASQPDAAGDAGSPPEAGEAAASLDGARGSEAGSPPASDATAGADGGGDGSVTSSQTCTSPAHVLPMNPSNPQDGIMLGGFYVDTDTWNAAGYKVTQTMYVCDYNDWYVVASMDNSTGDGAVKTYPNVHEDFTSAPAISSFSTVSSRFAHTAPHVGIYEYAYDIWLNGVAASGSTEVMIWTDNYNQVPSGSLMETVTLGGQTYKVYKSGSYIAFVEATNVTSGTLDLLSFFNHIIAKGWVPSTSTLGAVDYGIELVSTGGANATFQVNDFSLTAN